MTTGHAQLPNFLRKGHLGAFLTVVSSGEVVYGAFEGLKGSLLIPLQQMLHISSSQFGLLMSYIGMAVFFYVPAGWINNRFKVRTILFWCLAWRLGTYLVLFITIPPFAVMSVIAISWGVLDAIMWPAVVNGVSVLSAQRDQQGKGLAMGLLEAIQRVVEVGMGGLVIVVIMVWSGHTLTVMRIAALVYTLLLIPMMIAVARLVPDNPTACRCGRSDAMAALTGLLSVLARPKVWLAGLAAMAVFWCYINLIYTSAPYLTQVFGLSAGLAGAFGIFDTGVVGIIAGLIAGVLADYVFKSSARMMALSLGAVAVICVVLIVAPVGPATMWPTLILLTVVATAVFLGMAVILAPIAELGLPSGICGSAMSVGSLLAYASVFWAYALNGLLIDADPAHPADGYRAIFIITAVVALVGLVAAGILSVANRHARSTAAQRVTGPVETRSDVLLRTGERTVLTPSSGIAPAERSHLLHEPDIRADAVH